MREPIHDALESASSQPVEAAHALALAEVPREALGPVLEAAASRRNHAFGATLSYSPKVFLPLTNLCRNHCDYCTFRRSSGDAGEWTMSTEEVEQSLREGANAGAVEALLCLGDRPETAFAAYRSLLARSGQADTTDRILEAARRALSQGLLPHTNAGLLSAAELARLRPWNVSMGLMLENISPRLCAPGMPHHRARDKRPELRVQMIRMAGELRIAFTTGILIGIGETRRERVESLLAIREEHARHGHIQEVIVQNFRSHPETPMARAPEPADFEVAHSVALARLILPDEVTVQAPPNLNPHATELLVQAGLNDFGGISPVTPDFINPRHPWPHLATLYAQTQRLGFDLRPRLPVHDHWLSGEWVETPLLEVALSARERLAKVRHPGELGGVPGLPEDHIRLRAANATDLGSRETRGEGA